MHQEHNNIIERLEYMNRRYIRRPECKQTLEDAVLIIKQFHLEDRHVSKKKIINAQRYCG